MGCSVQSPPHHHEPSFKDSQPSCHLEAVQPPHHDAEAPHEGAYRDKNVYCTAAIHRAVCFAIDLVCDAGAHCAEAARSGWILWCSAWRHDEGGMPGSAAHCDEGPPFGGGCDHPFTSKGVVSHPWEWLGVADHHSKVIKMEGWSGHPTVTLLFAFFKAYVAPLSHIDCHINFLGDVKLCSTPNSGLLLNLKLLKQRGSVGGTLSKASHIKMV